MGGWCQHYTAKGADVGGRKGQTYQQFLNALKSVQTHDTKAYEKLTEDRVKNTNLERAIF